MSPRNIVEIESVSLPRELRQYRDDDRWVAYTPDGYVSEAASYSEAIRLANGRGGADTAVGFLEIVDEPVAATVAVDWSKPLPSVISRKKKQVT